MCLQLNNTLFYDFYTNIRVKPMRFSKIFWPIKSTGMSETRVEYK